MIRTLAYKSVIAIYFLLITAKLICYWLFLFITYKVTPLFRSGTPSYKVLGSSSKIPSHYSFHVPRSWNLGCLSSTDDNIANLLGHVAATAASLGVHTVSFYHPEPAPSALVLQIASYLMGTPVASTEIEAKFKTDTGQILDIYALWLNADALEPNKGLVHYVFQSMEASVSFPANFKVMFYNRNHNVAYLDHLCREISEEQLTPTAGDSRSLEHTVEAKVAFDFQTEPQLLTFLPELRPFSIDSDSFNFPFTDYLACMRMHRLDEYPSWLLSLTELHVPSWSVLANWSFSVYHSRDRELLFRLIKKILDEALSQYDKCEMRYGR